MNKNLTIKITFCISFICTLIGIVLKIMHTSSEVPFIAIGIGLSAVYTPMVLLELLSSKRLNTLEKLMWLRRKRSH